MTNRRARQNGLYNLPLAQEIRPQVDPLIVAADLEYQAAMPNAWDGHGRADQIDNLKITARLAASELRRLAALAASPDIPIGDRDV